MLDLKKAILTSYNQILLVSRRFCLSIFIPDGVCQKSRPLRRLYLGRTTHSLLACAIPEPHTTLVFFSLKGLLCCVVPSKLLASISHELLHRLYLVRVPFDEFSIRVREAKKARQLMFSLRCFPNQYRLYCLWIWFDATLVHHPPEVLYRVLQHLSF